MPAQGRFRFADYELDAATGELTGPAGRRRLEPQPARVLAVLLARAGELVSREELQREVWPDTHVELDQGLNYCIRQIRGALEDRADRPRFVETLPRRGYRFLVPVAGVGAAPTAGAAAAAAIPTPAAASARPRWPLLALLVALLLTLGVVAAWRLGAGAGPPATPVRPVRLALLPFHAPGEPPRPVEVQLTEALLVALTERGGARLAVIGPATTGGIAGGEASPAELARRLEVELVLAGAMRRDGATVFAHLLRAPGGEHLWATTVPLGGDPDAAGRAIAEAAYGALPGVAAAAASRNGR